MSLYGDYIKERAGKGIIESEHGFCTYILANTECYIEDLYVVPEQRNSKVASEMADKVADIAKEAGCEWLTGSVCPSAQGSTASLRVLLAYGMELLRSEQNMIYFAKRIK